MRLQRFMHDYEPPGKIYWWTTFVIGASVIGVSLAQVSALPTRDQLQVIVGMAIATLAGWFPVRIPGSKISVACAEIFVLLLLLLYGPAAASLAAACEASAESARSSKRLTSWLGSPAMAALAMYGCGTAFSVIHSLSIGYGLQGIGTTFALLLVTALAYFSASTLLMGSGVALKYGRPLAPFRMLLDHSWLALVFVVSASISGILYVTQEAIGATAVLVGVPVIALCQATLHLFFRQREADGRIQEETLAAAERERAKLEHIAYHDGLTDLPNRSYFFRELDRAVSAHHQEPTRRYAVMFLDFDGFKSINDTLGHGAGDELLKTAAGRLRHCLRPGDLVARLGGDEFVVLIEGQSVHEEAIDLAGRIKRVLAEPMQLGGSSVTTSASIGITTSAFGYDVPDGVMRDADTALYRAKARGKACHEMFGPDLPAEASRQVRPDVDLPVCGGSGSR